ncbi:adenosylhomocysteine nucleosidase [Marinactinospora thermotolerans DSM 45154]|uniref:Adenosylhomocysteine nucleosidase n=1 Tax=Marinactinospora thermotolerans DSM 45154 TaxID=1122192 RepID=A0A1T4NL17_9ACTN|nr:5'-methylthioadenosine/S-adenosylhomocysteine nucleosidase [Marinactinospora thermotolerans]SJZ79882.1 adenosylhomocysteine nucleosidase [Marinactinospora thermotolerans DSM 45154]
MKSENIREITNSGIMNLSGTTQVYSSAVGDGASIGESHDHSRINFPNRMEEECHIGIVTILAEEAAAVVSELGIPRRSQKVGPLRFYKGEIDTGEGVARVAVIRALSQGQRAAMGALENLRRCFSPKITALVGIGGGIHSSVAVGDVVVATRVVYYDLRRESHEGVQPRGEERESPASILHSVNAFFTDHEEPATLTTATGKFRVFTGPIGSGEAVVTDDRGWIKKYLTSYNDKILAVDMEAGAITQFSQENSAISSGAPEWLVVRGISDKADATKNDDHHKVAAINAAATLKALIPYLI